MAEKGAAARAKVARMGPCIVLRGGPLGNRWYTASDWTAMCKAEQWGIQEAGEQRPAILAYYRETSRHEANTERDLDGLTGKVWEWKGPTEERPTRGARSR